MRLSFKKLATIGIFASLSMTATAHHGFTGEYDNTKPIWLQGTVQTVTFQHPHAVLKIAVQKDNPKPKKHASATFLTASPIHQASYANKTVSLEFPPISRFNSLNGQIKKGDKIALIAYRNCESPHQLRVQWIRLNNGKEVERSGRVQTEVAGCHH